MSDTLTERFRRRPIFVRTIWVLVIVALAFGTLMVSEASAAYVAMGGNSAFIFIAKQFGFAIVGLVLFFLATRLPMRVLQRTSEVMVVLTLVLLVLVPFIGQQNYGGTRWLGFGSFTLQPSEILKLVAIVYLATHLPYLRRRVYPSWMPVLIILPLLAGVVMVAFEPDMGSALLILSIITVCLLVGGVELKLLGWLGGVGAFLLLVVYESFGYAQTRLQTFLGLLKGPKAVAAHIQIDSSLNALGSGGWHGLGLGHSRAIWGVLTNAHTDFIFSVVGEELGVCGTLSVVCFFAALVYCGTKIASRARDTGSVILASGVTFWLGFQAFVNMASVSKLIPVIGVPLPFLSYGGTSLMMDLLAMGVLLNIGLHEGMNRVTELPRLPVPGYLSYCLSRVDGRSVRR
jgi:cell division protein FtsW